ncbi:hypothetical protein [Arcobacter roscoffensis]|uniref:ABC transporter ATP-binding protein n=1 Tax=Arcobacter roscoffensis TaxID=2961520 RepID=A0ABY5E5S3_9BACT|nr:hypothetical protein [Arcobacter roscoffensis]UTJ07207.1 hypothetical protein NJU99_03715 [Arcobacter roscoffensis]
MFKQVKSALFWYYLYKFRKRVILIALLLLIAIFANAIYSDIVEYLKLKDKLEFLELALIIKWMIVIFNLTFSIYLVLTLFKKTEVVTKNSIKEKNTSNNKKMSSRSELTDREKSFLHKDKLKSKADYLVDK